MRKGVESGIFQSAVDGTLNWAIGSITAISGPVGIVVNIGASFIKSQCEDAAAEALNLMLAIKDLQSQYNLFIRLIDLNNCLGDIAILKEKVVDPIENGKKEDSGKALITTPVPKRQLTTF